MIFHLSSPRPRGYIKIGLAIFLQMDPESRWLIQERIGGGGQGDVFRCLRKEMLEIQQEYMKQLFEFNHTSGILVFGERSGDPQRARFWNSFRRLAEYDKPENQFVIKKLKPKETNKHFEAAIQRTNQEIQVMKAVKHPHLLELVDCDTVNEWYVSPYYPLGSLDKNLHHYAGDFTASLKLFRPIVAAVAELHNHKVVHRDIKPHNILLKSYSYPIVGDMGLTYYMGTEQDRLTLTAESVGTKYWRPEWAAGIRLDDVKPSFDTYSLGKVFWALLSGKMFLNLWYWDRQEFDVERLFPQSKWIHLAKEIFRRTIVQEEHDCESNAVSLLELVDHLIRIISDREEPFLTKPERTCLACGKGRYKLEVDAVRHQMENFGWSPAGGRRFNILACENCGHIQAFTTDGGKDPEMWNTWKD